MTVKELQKQLNLCNPEDKVIICIDKEIYGLPFTIVEDSPEIKLGRNLILLKGDQINRP